MRFKVNVAAVRNIPVVLLVAGLCIYQFSCLLHFLDIDDHDHYYQTRNWFSYFGFLVFSQTLVWFGRLILSYFIWWQGYSWTGKI